MALAPVGISTPEIVRMENSNFSIALGRDFQAMLRVGPAGRIKKASKITVTLRKDLGEIANMSFGSKKSDEEEDDNKSSEKKENWMITEAGYIKMNRWVGLQISPTKDVGGFPTNPYFERNKEHGYVEGVHTCYDITGYDMKGTLVTVEQAFFFDVNQYIIESIYSLTKNKRFPVQGIQVIGLHGELPDPQKFIVIPIDGFSAFKVEIGSKAWDRCIKIANRLRKESDRRGGTICRRLAFSRHPAFGISKPERVDNGVAYVELFVWMADERTKNTGRRVERYSDDSNSAATDEPNLDQADPDDGNIE